MDSILEVKDLSKSYKSFTLDKVSFALPRGYIMGFIGPNGAGKTTTIKLIMNLIKKDIGQIYILGKDNLIHQKEVKNKIGFVYDENYFYEYLTLNEMKQIVAPFYQYWDEALFKKYLKKFGLPAGKKIKELSRGMKTKYSLALALSHHAELIIMDEPTSGLDPVFRSELLDILQDEIKDENKGVFFSTHITSDLEQIADYICFINDGKVVFSETRDEVMENHLIIKGPNHLLKEGQNFLLGIRKNEFGFEALSNKPSEAKKYFGDQAIYEKPRLDQIILYTVRREKYVSSY